jgi:hypothetical protein
MQTSWIVLSLMMLITYKAGPSDGSVAALCVTVFGFHPSDSAAVLAEFEQ